MAHSPNDKGAEQHGFLRIESPLLESHSPLVGSLSTTFSGDEFFFAGHRFGASMVVPGTVQIELMAGVAVALIKKTRPELPRMVLGKVRGAEFHWPILAGESMEVKVTELGELNSNFYFHGEIRNGSRLLSSSELLLVSAPESLL